MTFRFYRFRFCFTPSRPLWFPPWKSANLLRGAFGTLLADDDASIRRVFSPQRTGGPSGLRQPPRPFVFRAAHLDGRRFGPGVPFHFDLHLFFSAEPPLPALIRAFGNLKQAGLGPGRVPVELQCVDQLRTDGSLAARVFEAGQEASPAPPEALELSPPAAAVGSVRVCFLTPTELKSGDGVAAVPEFAFLFARLRDRISTLRALYGDGPLDIDFSGMGVRSRAVRIASSSLRGVEVSRRSSRTGQTHPIGGFLGEVCYQGPLSEFLPYLRAGRWTGVGRQTVWGKGEIEVTL